jgi:hypothetical protein
MAVADQQMVFLERFNELTHIRFSRSPVDPELARKLFRDFGLGTALLQEFQNSRSYEIEAEHLPVEDVEDDSAILAVRGPYAFGNSHDRESCPWPAVPWDVSYLATAGVG